MENIEKYSLVGSKKCKEVLALYTDYKVFWTSGFKYRGASEIEMVRDNQFKAFVREGLTAKKVFLTFEERMQEYYNWSAAIDIRIDHTKKEIHFNGFSENDMF